MRLALVAVLCAALAACHRAPPPPMPSPHYVLGDPYQAGGLWYYPRDLYEGEQTGIAAPYEGDHETLTADGELFDQTALAAAHQTVQLPAIARVTNLDNGREITLRINDRGPASPARLLAVTRRAADLLAMTGPARVRMTVLPGDSHAAVDQVGGGPTLAIQAAPRDAVQTADLPPPGTESAAPVQQAAAPAPATTAGPIAIPRLPEIVYQTYASPGTMEILCGTFSTYGPANIVRARVGGLGARIDEERTGRQRSYTVRIGPIDSIAEADALLDRAIRAGGVTDARIVIE